ncbi:MAG: hypothetical protein KJZ86_27860 [Caldilineaceae bacterium]|nr:hypothetical protein [Caldilineaceae bacterium]
MTTVTIEVSAPLAQRLSLHKDRIDEIVGSGLGELSPLPNRVYRYILAFLAGNPTTEEIARFRPSPEMQERLRLLLERGKTQPLTAAEQAELDEYERIEHLMIPLKTHSLPTILQPTILQ